MRSLYDDEFTQQFTSDLEFLVYTSQLFGKEASLSLHGSGNSSVKSMLNDQEILYIKSNGANLAKIQSDQFTPLKLDSLKKIALLQQLTDTEMVLMQKETKIDANDPEPSIQALLHAIIPFKYVDQISSDVLLTLLSTHNSESIIEKLFPNYLMIPYMLPGVALVQSVCKKLKHIDWDKCEGIILDHYGLITFDNDPKISYEKMIQSVSKVEEYLDKNALLVLEKYMPRASLDIALLQTMLSKEKGYDVCIRVNQSPLALHYASQRNLRSKVTRGVLMPEDIIRTKRNPMVIDGEDLQNIIEAFEEEYVEYYNEFTANEVICNPSANWAVVKNFGTLSFGKTEKEAMIIEEITNRTMRAILRADLLGGFESISLSDSFTMEYWELEQAKIKN